MTRSYNAYTLKMIAIIGMMMQHTVLVIGSVIPTPLHFPLQFAGGFTFPIMAFLLVEGYKHTSNVKKYLMRIFIFALVSQPFHMWAFATEATQESGIFGINIMFTLFLGLLLLVMYDHMTRRGLFWFLFAIITLATVLFDWGIVGPVMILLYHVVKSEKLRRTIPPALGGWYSIMFAFVIGMIVGIMVELDPSLAYKFADILGDEGVSAAQGFAGMLFPVGMIASIPLIRGYNGERGRSMKYLFYAFYPLHLLVLALLSHFVI